MGLLAGIGSIMSGAGSLAGTGFNIWSQNAANKKNEKLMRDHWYREDTAVQRRVADLKAAGLSPVLAAGSAAGSGGVSQINPQRMEGNAGDSITEYYQNKAKLQEIENQVANLDVIKESAELNRIQQQLGKAQTRQARSEAEIAKMDEKRYRRTGFNPRRDIKNELGHTGAGAVSSEIKDIKNSKGAKNLKKSKWLFDPKVTKKKGRVYKR